MSPPHRPKTATAALLPSLKSFGTLLIVLSSISPASSVFIIMPAVIAKAGTGSILSFAFAAALSLLMACVYAELASAFPTTGGEYPVIGRTLNRYWAFIMLVLTVCYSVWVIATMSLGISAYLGVLGFHLDVQWTAVAMLVGATGVAILNIRVNAFVTGMFLLIEILTLALLSVLGLIHVEHPLMSMLHSPTVFNAASGQLMPSTIALCMGASAVALFSFEGFGSAIYLGEETLDARRKIGQVIVFALVISVLTQLVPLIAVLMGTPDLVSLMQSTQMMGYFIEEHAGQNVAMFASLAVATAIFNAMIAIILQSGRLVYATGRDCIWVRPVNTALASVHARFNSPLHATVVIALASVVACFIQLDTLMLLSGTTIIAIHALLCVGVVVGRSNGTTSHGYYRMPWFPLPAVLCLLGMGYVFYLNLIDVDFGRPSLIINGEIILAASVYYFLFLSRRTDWQFHIPGEATNDAGPE